MKFFWYYCIIALALISTSAIAADIAPYETLEPLPAQTPFFGFVEGGYIFPDLMKQYNTYNDSSSSTPPVGPGAGWRGKALLGLYFTHDLSVMVAGEYGTGGPSDIIEAADRESQLHDNYLVLDGMIGYDLSPNLRIAGGVRWVNWDNTTHSDFSIPSRIYDVHNDFQGIGPHLQFDASLPLFDSSDLTLEAGAGASYLFGSMFTHGDGYWNFWQNAPDVTRSVNAYNLDASIGIGYRFSQHTKAVIGWQGQYWNGINVGRNAVQNPTPLDGRGISLLIPDGSSAELRTGPFVRLNF